MRMQERVESDQTENYIVHNSLDRFFINSHAFHNAHLLRAALPRDLLAPIPLFPDRRAKHDELATQLRENVTTRKAAVAAQKRKRLEEDDNDEREGRPRKRKRAKARGPKKIQTAESMVANRKKRAITLSRKAKDALEAESDSEEEEADDSSSDEFDEGYSDGSDSDYYE